MIDIYLLSTTKIVHVISSFVEVNVTFLPADIGLEYTLFSPLTFASPSPGQTTLHPFLKFHPSDGKTSISDPSCDSDNARTTSPYWLEETVMVDLETLCCI